MGIASEGSVVDEERMSELSPTTRSSSIVFFPTLTSTPSTRRVVEIGEGILGPELDIPESIVNPGRTDGEAGTATVT